jgi:hypothetical protein
LSGAAQPRQSPPRRENRFSALCCTRPYFAASVAHRDRGLAACGSSDVRRPQASMPIRHGGIAASRTSTWPRDHFCRSTIAPRRSRPATWNEFLPISMPIVAIREFVGHGGAPFDTRPIPASLAGGAGARPDIPLADSGCRLPTSRFSAAKITCRHRLGSARHDRFLVHPVR